MSKLALTNSIQHQMDNDNNINKVHNNLSVLQKLSVSGASLKDKHWYDPISEALADFLTSVLLIIIVMVAFLCGIAIHIKAVFDSWFLAIGFQSVVLLTSVNSDLLPKYKQLPIIAICMSLLTCVFVFLSFDGHLSTGVMLAVNIIKALAVAGVEFIFAYLFCARNNRTKAEKQGYRFDLEGRVVATPFDNNFAKQVKESEQSSTFEPSPTSESTPLKKPTFPASDANIAKQFDKTCECGQYFDNEAEWLKHVETCDVHKWFAEQA